MKRFSWFVLGLVVVLCLGAVRFSDTLLKLGDKTDTDVTIEADIGQGTSNPVVKYNTTSDEWQFSNDGSNFQSIGSGGGASGVQLLENPGFESGEADWTSSGGTFNITSTAANVGNGSKGASWDAGASGDYLVSGQKTVPTGLFGRNCQAEIWYKGADSNITLQVINSVPTVLASRVFTEAASGFKRVSLDFSCPTSGSIALRIYATGNAPSAYFDEAFLGEKDPRKEVKNYIHNGDIEDGTLVGVGLYDDGAVDVPVDGTGGAPTTLTLGSTSTDPLEGKYSFELSHSAADGQGEGFSYDFSLDYGHANLPKPLQISFTYEASSAFDCGNPSDPTDPSDVVVYVYNVDSSELIEASPRVLDCSGYYSAYFQPKGGDDDYRLIFHLATTNALAYTLKIDSLKISDVQSVNGVPSTDWVEFTPDLSNFVEGSTNVGWWRRVGDSMEVRFVSAHSGAGGGSFVALTLPNGAVIATGKAPSSSSNAHPYGNSIYVPASGNTKGMVVVGTAGNSFVAFIKEGEAEDSIDGPEFVDGDEIGAAFIVPVEGWGAEVAMSEGSSTRVISARANGVSEQVFSTSESFIKFNTTDFDDVGGFTHNAFSAGGTGTSNGTKYTVEVAGKYQVNVQIPVDRNGSAWASNSRLTARLYVNQSEVKETEWYSQGTNSGRVVMSISDTLSLKSADELQVSLESSVSTVRVLADTTQAVFSVSKESGPATVAASEVVAARYSSRSSATTYASGTHWYLDFDNLDIDTHGAVDQNAIGSTSTDGWIFTAPKPGIYNVQACAAVQGDFSSGNRIILAVRKNGSTAVMGDRIPLQATVTNIILGGCAVGTLELQSGDTLQVTIEQNSGGARAIRDGGANGLFDVSITSVQ